MNLTRRDLAEIFSLAKDIYVSDKNEGLTHQEYVAQCYLKAAENFIEGLNLTYPIRTEIEGEGT